MILIHGTEGLLGRTLLSHIIQQNTNKIVLVTDNSQDITSTEILAISQQDAVQWIRENGEDVEACILLDNSKASFSSQFTASYLSFFKQVWRRCVEFNIPFIYTSTFETYGGDGRLCEENELALHDLQPTSHYGQLKHTLDEWVSSQSKKPYFWASLKLTELYSFAEVQALEEPQQASNEPVIPMISVHDVANVIYYLLRYRRNAGIYHVTSNQWLPLSLIDKMPSIDKSMPLVGLPEKCNVKTGKLRTIGYTTPFTEIPIKRLSTVHQS